VNLCTVISVYAVVDVMANGIFCERIVASYSVGKVGTVSKPV